MSKIVHPPVSAEASSTYSTRIVLNGSFVQNVNQDEKGNTVIYLDAEDLRIPPAVNEFLEAVCGDFSDVVRAKIYQMSTMHILQKAIVEPK